MKVVMYTFLAVYSVVLICCVTVIISGWIKSCKKNTDKNDNPCPFDNFDNWGVN